jgi:hypothetical protein
LYLTILKIQGYNRWGSCERTSHYVEFFTPAAQREQAKGGKSSNDREHDVGKEGNQAARATPAACDDCLVYTLGGKSSGSQDEQRKLSDCRMVSKL